MNLFRAHNQWATRPDDERFQSLAQLHAAVKGYAALAREATVEWTDLRVGCADAIDDESATGDLRLFGRKGIPATVSHHAFGQLAARVGAPASYLRQLPAALAAENLNHGLQKRDANGNDCVLLLHDRGGDDTHAKFVVRGLTTDVYERLWNWEVTERLLDLSERFDLVPAAATFSWDGQDHSKDKALYASDHDMFVFLMARNRDVGRAGEQGLFRGLIVANTEVGGISLAVDRFLFRDICQNHIIWGAKDLTELRMRHVGDIHGKWGDVKATVTRYLDASSDEEHELITATSSFKLGDTKEEVLDTIFGKRFMTRKGAAQAYDAVVEDEDGPANTAWGFTQGLTRHAQTVPYADERTQLDRVGRKILQLAF
jgi:hypothetical protein